ncbi:hypothetical protein HDV64DRAFT_243956 [Trichoderma sp. TUCIM 5745]
MSEPCRLASAVCLLVCSFPLSSPTLALNATQLNSLHLFLFYSLHTQNNSAITRQSAERQGHAQQTRTESTNLQSPVQIEPICTSACPSIVFFFLPPGG